MAEKENVFHFKQFSVKQKAESHKVGTDGVLLGSWIDLSGARTIIDIGTGTGLIALMLAQRTGPEVRIDAVEINEAAAVIASENVRNSPWQKKIHVIHTSIQDHHPKKKYDLMVTNPPYFENSLRPPEKSRADSRHNYSLTPRHLIDCISRMLASRGRFCIILPATEAKIFQSNMEASGFFMNRGLDFFSRPDKPVERKLMEFSRQPNVAVRENLVLYDRQDQWSDPYKKLLQEFYIKL